MPLLARGTAAMLGVCLAIVPAAIVARRAQLLPVDEATSQPAFFSFRARLQAAVARRDVAALVDVVDPQIKNTFGGDDGIEGFFRLWHLDGSGRPDDLEPMDAADGSGDDIWAELGAVLALGGTFSGETIFQAPYTYSRWPGAVDAFEHVVLVASDVLVRASPSPDAPVVAAMSFEILPVPRSAAETPGWTAVQIDPARTGYVASRLVRSPLDYRAIFSREKGRWRLVTFVAGD